METREKDSEGMDGWATQVQRHVVTTDLERALLKRLQQIGGQLKRHEVWEPLEEEGGVRSKMAQSHQPPV